MTSIPFSPRSVNGREALEEAMQQGMQALCQTIDQYIIRWLDQAVTYLLGRELYVRRETIDPWLEQDAHCARCGSRVSHRFSRNGSRPRTLSFLDFTLHLRLPRVICECGGSVRLDFGGFLRPYQRLADAVDERIHRWATLCLSLRQMQSELRQCQLGPLGFSTLLKRLHQLRDLTPQVNPSKVPPVLQVDAIWLTQLRPNGRVRRDAKGRQRSVKGRFKRPLFIALGLWPATGHVEILAWQLGLSEDTKSWLTFLTYLEEQGIRSENGLELIIHDGGSGLCSALVTVYYDTPTQRCLFHKLRNIAKALQFPESCSPKERKRLSKAILKEIRAIWEAKRYSTALRRYLHVCRKYRTSQPKAIATLRRDFRQTLTYYHFESHQPAWPRNYLRTTSHLERFNRSLRQHTRAANAYHSDDGVLAMVAQQAAAWNSSHACIARP
jgi:transposase-like protein